MSSVYRHLDGAWEMWRQVDGLVCRVIYSLAVGEDGSVWIATTETSHGASLGVVQASRVVGPASRLIASDLLNKT